MTTSPPELTNVDLVRLLISDPAPRADGGEPVFTDDEINGFLTLEGGSVKLAAAQAIDTIADDEALTSKVIRDGRLGTDGAKVADALRKRAAALRKQADEEDEDGAGGVFFELIPGQAATCGPELASWWGPA